MQPTEAQPSRTYASPTSSTGGIGSLTGSLAGLSLSSPSFSFELHGGSDPPYRLDSAPSPPSEHVRQFQSPMRQHKRTPSVHREVKETLDARSQYTSNDADGRSHFRVNQYVIKDEIGRGSYGAVHLATDQFGNEYAVKEFSKARLRKRAQSNVLRHKHRGPGRAPRTRAGFGAPDAPDVRLTRQVAAEAQDALFWIREEIAIMKKLNHPNLVQLIEVLDDPEEDSLFMVLEMCKKGVVMKVGVDDTAAEPYPEETCRYWFRDLILGVEYLHAQGVVHRDIKPDNLLLTDDDVLKIVDFGVSEMFEKAEPMRTAKSAGSPAFLPPELCIARHGDISGKAADIWSMGVSLYCLRYGRVPFQRQSVLDMYEAIKDETPSFPPDENKEFLDLMNRLMEKDPAKRITMEELRVHPWVTRGGDDPLLTAEENCSEPIDLPNALEVNHAFTRRMSHLLCVMKAISKFKSLLSPKETKALSRGAASKSPEEGEEEAGGNNSTPRAPSSTVRNNDSPTEAEKPVADFAARVLRERERLLEGSSGSIRLSSDSGPSFLKAPSPEAKKTEPLTLGIGTGGHDEFKHCDDPAYVVSDSPTAVDFNVYDRAFEDEVERIKRSTSRRGNGSGNGTLYATKHLVAKAQYGMDKSVNWVLGSRADRHSAEKSKGTSSTHFSKIMDMVAKATRQNDKDQEGEKGEDVGSIDAKEG